MKKIIFITREGYSLPGARIRCYGFAKELLLNGLAARVLSFADTLGAADGAQESAMRIADKIRFNWRAFLQLLEDKESLFYLQRFNYHAFAPYLAHCLRGNRIVLDLDDWEMRENPRYYLGFYPSSKAHYLTRQIAQRSIFCIAGSQFLQDFLSRFNSKVYYIPTGVDARLFRPAADKQDKNKVVFSWVGTLHRQEYIDNINLALECFAALRKRYDHIFFEIAGDGIYRGGLVRMVEEKGDSHIILKGWIPPQEVPAYLNTVHAGLLPVSCDNKFNRSKSPTKLFEYMAAAKPVIASDIAEASLILHDGRNGFLAKTREEFTAKMQLVIENPSLCRHIGAEARSSVERHYSLEILGRHLADIFKEI